MIIYRAGVYDRGEYYSPDCVLGIYTDLEIAKTKAYENSNYLDEIPYVDVLELHGKEFELIGEWKCFKEDEQWSYE